jgi:hypothetical protein
MPSPTFANSGQLDQLGQSRVRRPYGAAPWLSLPGARRRGQLALPADEAAVFVPVMMAGERLKSEFSRQSPLEPINELD